MAEKKIVIRGDRQVIVESPEKENPLTIVPHSISGKRSPTLSMDKEVFNKSIGYSFIAIIFAAYLSWNYGIWLGVSAGAFLLALVVGNYAHKRKEHGNNAKQATYGFIILVLLATSLGIAFIIR